MSSYSVYPLYSPFRLVIDCLRESATVAANTDVIPHARPDVPASVPARTAIVRKDPPLLQAQPVPWTVGLPAVPIVVLPPPSIPTPQPIAAPSSDVAKGALPELPVPAPPARNLAGGLSIARQLGLGVSRIVIDPGHGGHDPGAKGAGVTEADLVLDVALRLERLLTKLPGVEVVLTRRENEFVSLQERTAIANRENADLFLSIHANASSVAAARGVETYFLNFASNRSAAAVAARENATSGQTMGSLQDVIKSIALNSKLDESRDFATYVQREMMASLRAANSGLKDLGVKQAPFVVLIGAEMPSILAEISFVTNPQEARLLKTAGYRQKVAQALFEGVRKYQGSLKSGSAVAQQQN
ncbi:MAG: N-acetylmuramoyl-L-alanine amidase [Vicinamibacterales bacterium]